MEVILGNEAIAAGKLTRGALRWNYTAILPGIYMSADAHHEARRAVVTRAKAAWLWTGREGIIAGRTAAALWGASWVENTAPVELIAKPRRAQPGVVLRNERIEADEVCTDGFVPITTPARTALDLARRLPREDALRHVDAISQATGLSLADMAPLQKRYRGARGVASAWSTLSDMDGGSRTPQDTTLRLWLIDGGLPRPTTSIHVGDDRWESVISMGWPGAKVGVEWAESRSGLIDHVQFQELLQRLGWILLRALPNRGRTDVIYRARAALRLRGLWG
ncbi:MAG: hypothetical protein Q7V01_11295 [Vicinamibacterales bacterium]|nr:hypothetical protein [Vicinamibacterales bacterium]